MGDIFEAVGFKLQDEAAYQQLAEASCQRGTSSTVSRHNTLLRGYCWSLEHSIEIWTILNESKKGTYFADCRPAFRSRRICEINGWEILEFIEDGEVLVSGSIQTLDLTFQLQNFTALDESVYHQPTLTANLAGLCYRVKVLSAPPTARITSLANSHTSKSATKYYENDYLVLGKVFSWRELSNPITHGTIFWLDVEVGEFRVELLVSQEQCQGLLANNVWISAEVWLQGHIVCHHERQAKYEGLDISISPADHWSVLRREN
jgi:hypothetical protein